MSEATLLYLARADLPDWLGLLARTRTVLAPRSSGGAGFLAPYSPGTLPDLDRDTVAPPKGAVFPQTKVLLRYLYHKDPELHEVDTIRLEPDLSAVPTVVFGSRPCGARGFETFEAVFVRPGLTDPYYLSQRRVTTFVTLACAAPEPGCFCHWVGGGPADPTGSDLLLTPAGDGFTVRVLTEAGAGLVKDGPFRPAEAGERDLALAATRQALSALGPVEDLSGAMPALKKVFSDLDFWDDMAAACISCGACTYLCPTCHCFNITDESDGVAGVRLRTWDSCMFAQYSLEASGHNPRPTKSHRLRNRIGHKFWYHPARHGGALSCCGCGRCIRHCPGAVDIRRVLKEAMARARD